MARIGSPGITFRGLTSAAMKVHVANIPSVPLAEERGSAVKIPGRDGQLWLADGAYEPIRIKVDIELHPDADFGAVAAWLSGSGDLILSDFSDYKYRARIIGGFDMTSGVFLKGFYRTSVTFVCQPFRYLAADDTMAAITTAGTFAGSGTWPAQPLIAVHGSGDISLMINGYTVLLDDVDGTAALDCEAMMAFDGSGNNISRKVTLIGPDDADEWPVLNTGVNLIGWTGTVTDVVITPHWRWR